jgi:hypothetical protein
LFVTDGSCLFNLYLAEIVNIDASWEVGQRNSLANLISFEISHKNVLKSINKAEILVLSACA